MVFDSQQNLPQHKPLGLHSIPDSWAVFHEQLKTRRKKSRPSRLSISGTLYSDVRQTNLFFKRLLVMLLQAPRPLCIESAEQTPVFRET